MKRRNFFLTLFGSLFLGKVLAKNKSQLHSLGNIPISGYPYVKYPILFESRKVTEISGVGGCGNFVYVSLDSPFNEKIHKMDCVIVASQHCVITNILSTSNIEIAPVYDTTDLLKDITIGDSVNLTIKFYHEI